MKNIIHPQISKINVYPSLEETARAAAEFTINIVLKNPQAIITYATGNTMIPVYQKITEKISKKEVDFSKTKAFHLDEYYPCDPKADYGFVNYLYKYVFGPFKIKKTNIFILNGLVKNPKLEADRYNLLLKKSPVDLAILGIGPGSHIGFNEQRTPFDTQTHLAKLSKETIFRDQKERGQDTPTTALTQGIGNILSAKKIILVAYGENKGEYLKPALWEKINSQYPASALRLQGQKVIIFIDQAAASKASKE